MIIVREYKRARNRGRDNGGECKLASLPGRNRSCNRRFKDLPDRRSSGNLLRELIPPPLEFRWKTRWRGLPLTCLLKEERNHCPDPLCRLKIPYLLPIFPLFFKSEQMVDEKDPF